MESIMKVIFLILSIQILKSKAQWVYDDDGCRTPGGGVGNCVVQTECPSIMSYRQQFKKLSKKQQEFLNSYRCGYIGRTVKMCCPKQLFVPIEVRFNKVDLLPFECGAIKLVDKVINGKRAGLNEFPWMALLFSSTNRGKVFTCGGTIINERYILTAAHCITNRLLSVRVGEHNVTSATDCETDRYNKTRCSLPALDIKIEKAIPHKKFTPSMAQNDIALIRLSQPINVQTENVKAICLPPKNSSFAKVRTLPSTNLLITGWGTTETGSLSDVLLTGSVRIANQTECYDTYTKNYNLNVSDNQFCFGGQGTNKSDSCNGDSGGPLLYQEYMNDDVRYVQQGIVSLGPRDCGHKGVPTLNTRVDQYIDWILENIEP